MHGGCQVPELLCKANKAEVLTAGLTTVDGTVPLSSEDTVLVDMASVFEAVVPDQACIPRPNFRKW